MMQNLCFTFISYNNYAEFENCLIQLKYSSIQLDMNIVIIRKTLQVWRVYNKKYNNAESQKSNTIHPEWVLNSRFIHLKEAYTWEPPGSAANLLVFVVRSSFNPMISFLDCFEISIELGCSSKKAKKTLVHIKSPMLFPCLIMAN